MALAIFSSDSDSSDLENMNHLSDWDTDSDDERPLLRKVRVNHMNNLDDAEFTFRFRLTKSAVQTLLVSLMPFIRVTSTR